MIEAPRQLNQEKEKPYKVYTSTPYVCVYHMWLEQFKYLES